MAREAKEFEDNIKGLNEKVNEMQQHLNHEEAKTGKMKEEMEVEVKLYHDKQDRLTKRVETLDERPGGDERGDRGAEEEGGGDAAGVAAHPGEADAAGERGCGAGP